MWLRLISLIYLGVIFVGSVYSDNECNAIINELNLRNPKSPGSNEFIELRSTCGDNLPLRGHKIIGFTCTQKSGAVILEVNLWNARMQNGFYTIGGDQVNSANINIPSTDIKYKDGFIPKANIGAFSKFTVTSNTHLSAIGLLYGNKEPFNAFKLTKEKNSIRIDDKLITILKEHLIDLVVYGSGVPCDKCELFEIIYPNFANRKYTLREIDTNKNRDDISLNRCTIENDGFLPESFKFGQPSPGKPNYCSGTNFILEDNILQAIPSVISSGMYSDDYDDLNGACSSSVQNCTSSIDVVEYSQVTTQQLENAVEKAQQKSRDNICNSLNLNPNSGNLMEEIERENNRKRVMGVETDYSNELEWKSTKYFR